MRNASVFWAIVLILVGVLFLLNNFGLLPNLNFSIWSLIWPIFLIALGVWFVSRTFIPRADTAAEPASIPLEGARQAEIELAHGAGELRVAAGARADTLAEGTFGGGLRYHSRRRGELLDVEMKMRVEPVAFLNWTPGGYDWDVRLNPDVSLALKLETGASKNLLDLRDLKVTELKLETGASASELTLPASAGYTRAKVQAGAARVDIRIPGGVAARIKASGALASVRVDETRFPGFDNRYQSPDYDSAANKVDIEVETGVGAVTVS
ncbi:MAG: LiaI-LiaF-like domain-containing protein [Nitrososphaerales archaeon]